MSIVNSSLVSVIMPAYNAEKTIEKSIKSVLSQDYMGWELIVINDCSNDKTMEIVERFMTDDSRIKMINLKKNAGISKARNIGIKHGKGRYLAFLDSDDIWRAKKLSSQLKFMASEGYAFTFTSYDLMDFNGHLLGKTIHAKRVVDYRKLLTNNCIGCLTVLIDRESIPVVTMPGIKHEDYATWLNILKKGIKAFGLDESLAVYRVSEHSSSANKRETISWIWTIYRRNQGFGILKSLFLLILNMSKLILKYVKTGRLISVIKRVR